MTKVLKSKEERLKEGISLLKQILDLVHDAELEAYLELKWPEVARWEMSPSPVEFDMYYSG